MFRKENGVTLVALVITIIVLLILAGVTISMVMGDGSIMDNAETAAINSEKAEQEDALRYAALIVKTDMASVGVEGAVTPKYTAFDNVTIKLAVVNNSDIPEANITAEAGASTIVIEGTYWTTTGAINTGNTFTVTSVEK